MKNDYNLHVYLPNVSFSSHNQDELLKKEYFQGHEKLYSAKRQHDTNTFSSLSQKLIHYLTAIREEAKLKMFYANYKHLHTYTSTKQLLTILIKCYFRVDKTFS
jgi:hypothetical protein